jgi:anti-sigma B factor antagonist
MTLLKISGQVDSYSAPVLDKMCRDVFALAGDRGRFIIMDMTNVSYMSSAGISIIVGWRKEAQERAGNIHFVGMTKEVVGVFKLLGIEDTLFICDNSNEAMWAFMKNK